MLLVTEIKKITGNYSVLYVEDEEIIRINMIPLLEIFFKKVYVAEDGLMGLEYYNRCPIDIVITDIQMPNMNGLEMTKYIREKSGTVPVIITTAFGDRDFFLTSINLKVDHYLLKPIEEENAKNVFYKVAQSLENRKKARELEELKIQEKINKTSEQVISQIANAYPNPCIIYMDGEVRYINKAFAALLDMPQLADLTGYTDALNHLFDQKEGYLRSLDAYDEDDPFKNKVSIARNNKRKIFRILKREVEIDTISQKSIMYTFNDITLEEYQKVKIKNYTDLLEIFIIKNRCAYEKHTPSLPAKQARKPEAVVSIPRESAKLADHIPAAIKTKAEEYTPKRIVGGEEKDVLRRSHIHKTSASEYVKELDEEILLELQELHELDLELESALDEFKEEGNSAVLATIASYLEVYAHKISLLFQFDDLSYAIRSLATLLTSIDTTKFDAKILHKLYILLNGIQGDLVSWRNNIFIDQSALDIHYFDSSLFSACLQIELAVSDDVKAVDTAEEDFELF